MAVSESVADYLEAIMMLRKEKANVRSIDIANHFGYSRPTVSQTLKSFRAKGYVNVDEDGFITLTEKGFEIAASTYERHVVLSQLLRLLGVGEVTAAEDACKLEHDLSDESFAAIKLLCKQLQEQKDQKEKLES